MAIIILSILLLISLIIGTNYYIKIYKIRKVLKSNDNYVDIHIITKLSFKQLEIILKILSKDIDISHILPYLENNIKTSSIIYDYYKKEIRESK